MKERTQFFVDSIGVVRNWLGFQTGFAGVALVSGMAADFERIEVGGELGFGRVETGGWAPFFVLIYQE
jgi:hypothetical protein